MENICKTCGYTHTLNYCNRCGQKVIDKRFTTKELLHDLFHNLIHFDKGFLFTFYSLLIRPQIVIKEYINGATKKYTNPATFAIYLIAFATFFIVRQDYIERNAQSISNFLYNQDQVQLSVQKHFLEFIKHYLQYFTLLYIPFFALVSKWLFKTYNYAEHLILICYTYALVTIISLPLTLLYDHYSFTKFVSIAIVVVYYTYTYHKLLSIGILKSFFKTILFYILSYFLFTFAFTFGTLLVLFIKKLIVGHAF